MLSPDTNSGNTRSEQGIRFLLQSTHCCKLATWPWTSISSSFKQGFVPATWFCDFYHNWSISPKLSLWQRASNMHFRESSKWENHVPTSESLLSNSLGSRPEFLPKCELSIQLKLFLKGRQSPWYHPSINLQMHKKIPTTSESSDKYTRIIITFTGMYWTPDSYWRQMVFVPEKLFHWVFSFCMDKLPR